MGTCDCVSVASMPKISGFYGIKIWMYHDEPQHLGRPHFHAEYAEHDATIDIVTLEILAGSLTKRTQRLVTEWADEHEAELLEDWELARQHKPLLPIDPLP
jgi:hypothetical protein